jgi:hypothetical protein
MNYLNIFMGVVVVPALVILMNILDVLTNKLLLLSQLAQLFLLLLVLPMFVEPFLLPIDIIYFINGSFDYALGQSL